MSHPPLHHMKIALDSAEISKTALETVRYNFNPSGRTRVDRLKVLAAALIHECELLEDESRSTDNEAEATNYSQGRAARIAAQGVEDACMWAVKAATT